MIQERVCRDFDADRGHRWAWRQGCPETYQFFGCWRFSKSRSFGEAVVEQRSIARPNCEGRDNQNHVGSRFLFHTTLYIRIWGGMLPAI